MSLEFDVYVKHFESSIIFSNTALCVGKLGTPRRHFSSTVLLLFLMHFPFGHNCMITRILCKVIHQNILTTFICQ